MAATAQRRQAGEGDFEPQRALAASLPGATEDLKWGADLVYSVGGKMFCVFLLAGDSLPRERHAATRSCSFKVEAERFLELTDVPGVIPAPYLARARWVQVGPGHALRTQDLDALVCRSHALVAAGLPLKTQRALGVLTAPPTPDPPTPAAEASTPGKPPRQRRPRTATGSPR